MRGFFSLLTPQVAQNIGRHHCIPAVYTLFCWQWDISWQLTRWEKSLAQMRQGRVLGRRGLLQVPVCKWCDSSSLYVQSGNLCISVKSNYENNADIAFCFPALVPWGSLSTGLTKMAGVKRKQREWLFWPKINLEADITILLYCFIFLAWEVHAMAWSHETGLRAQMKNVLS